MEFLTKATLLLFMSVFIAAGSAYGQEDIDNKIKKLQELEARVDAKLQKLEKLEARLEARLNEDQPQVVRATATSGSAGYVNGSATAAVGMAGAAAMSAAQPKSDELWGGQVSFRGGYTHLDSPARSAVFTGSGSGDDGYMVGAALDIPLLKDPWFGNRLLGQISMDYSGITGRTTFAVTGERGKQSLFKIAISPKYRIDTLGDWHPWIIPIGLSILLNSPPSDSVAYATVGGTTGAGIEYTLLRRFALGLAFSYNFYSEDRNRVNTNHLSVGPYVGINF